MIRISNATIDDVPELVILLGQLFETENDFSTNSRHQRKGLLRIIKHPEIGSILVMKDGAAVIGMVNLLYTVSTAEGGPVALLEDLILGPDYRGRGLGDRLFRHAIGHAKKKGISRITLLTDGDNRRAIRFYRRHGFTRSSMIPFRLLLRA